MVAAMSFTARMLVAAAAVAALLLAAYATATTTHTYPVTLTIKANKPEKKIEGDVTSPAPSEFCTTSTVRILHPKRGKDDLVATVHPVYSHWSFRIRPRRSGDRLYAQTLQYHLPNRPVVCLAARSRTVTAP